jgi:uncharacterized membrane protein YeaQ/YmgE (transglycosylase-associated protein family)
LICGLIAGFIGSKIVNKRGEGLIMDIVLGVVGAFVGGFLFRAFVGHDAGGPMSIMGLVVAVIGSVIVLVVFHAVRRA